MESAGSPPSDCNRVVREGRSVPSGEPIVLVWLVPITAAEAHYVNDRTWEAFEDLLEEVNPDLRDLGRASVV